MRMRTVWSALYGHRRWDDNSVRVTFSVNIQGSSRAHIFKSVLILIFPSPPNLPRQDSSNCVFFPSPPNLPWQDSSNCPTHVQSSNPSSSDPDTSGSLGPPAMASPAGDNSHLFTGVHFLLIGFDSVTKSQYRSKLVQSGGTDAMLFGGGCTHVVARGRVYDDPVCALARAQGSKVLSQIWLDDSLDRGVLADADRVIYWPARDLKGIPGSGSLHICLTGYQKKDREDSQNSETWRPLKMVSLMGAQFSKRLLAPSVTHLVCYKFEGEKYKLAESLGIKIVNHRWLEDCLKSWEILPVEDYSESGWILEIMEVQAKERLKFPIRDRLRAARRKRAVRKAKSSSKVLAAALALLNRAHPEVGTDFLACDDLPPDIQDQTAKYAEVAEAFVVSCSGKLKGDGPRQS